ncbi:uncharacterized protein F5147DRAFT_774238 [Suillus discolor]|uniref:Uncharacterized protein n=1 Tax=Suillus discolor TaxID=1912936 RepID=A0A9P7F4W3_9AGAM|nr:uncharacterized protein F5147DRAFT_774238 [Suillus discolor]KAG2107407.1 hypothetical protein F5147DRAFT_774238 [Suillus discolor]
MQTQAQSVYTSDPEHRLICVYSLIDDVRKIFVISTKIFFDIDQAAVIPWTQWGPGHESGFAGGQDNVKDVQVVYDGLQPAGRGE